MVKREGKIWLAVTTKSQSAWLDRPIAVLKRDKALEWKVVDVHFDTVEDAQEFTKFVEVLEAA